MTKSKHVSLKDKAIILSAKALKDGNPHREGTEAHANFEALKKAGKKGLVYATTDTLTAKYLHRTARLHPEMVVVRAA